MSQADERIFEKIEHQGLIPVATIKHADQACTLAKAIQDGGLDSIEITLRTKDAIDSIKKVSEKYRDMLLGAGTVLSIQQAKEAVDAGAKFIVSPGFDKDIVQWCIENQVPVIPGVSTPTEVQMATSHNLAVLKFFPAEALGGTKTLKAIGSPFPWVKFIPTGGINQGNLKEYLELPMVLACGGSWIIASELIEKGLFEEITNRVSNAVLAIRSLGK